MPHSCATGGAARSRDRRVAIKPRVELLRERLAGVRPHRRVIPFRELLAFQRRCVEAVEKLRIDPAYARNHLSNHLPRLARGVRCRTHAPQAVQPDPEIGVWPLSRASNSFANALPEFAPTGA